MSEVLQADLVVGVYTHLNTHTAAICDAAAGGFATAGTRHHGGVCAAARLGPVSLPAVARGLGR